MDPRAYYGRTGDDKWRNDRPATRPGLLPSGDWRNGRVVGQAAAAGNPYPGYRDHYSNTNDYWDKDYYQSNQGKDYYQSNQGYYQEWTSTQPSYGYGSAGLSAPTTDIGRAMDILTESATRPPAAQPWYGSPTPTVHARDRYSEAIDTRDAARRYGNYNLSSRPYRAGNGRSVTTESREAAGYYSGRTV